MGVWESKCNSLLAARAAEEAAAKEAAERALALEIKMRAAVRTAEGDSGGTSAAAAALRVELEERDAKIADLEAGIAASRAETRTKHDAWLASKKEGSALAARLKVTAFLTILQQHSLPPSLSLSLLLSSLLSLMLKFFKIQGSPPHANQSPAPTHVAGT